jgi:hypothetical protein
MTWDWLQLLPDHEQRRLRWRRRIQRLRYQLLRPRTTIAGLVLIYGIAILVLAHQTGIVLGLLAALPLLLAPALSALMYWLLWSEFHQ